MIALRDFRENSKIVITVIIEEERKCVSVFLEIYNLKISQQVPYCVFAFTPTCA